MAAHDISRHLFNPAKHYTGTRMQQGRVLLDSDLNEARMLDEEVQRTLVVDVIGPHGTPDSGFKISIAEDPPSYNFTILSGSYYLGGLRHEITDVGDPPAPQNYRGQDNWLQSNRTDQLPLHPTLPAAERHDLVYLVGWQQGVSAVEDQELREPAIAAQDAGFRVRNTHQVHVLPGGPADCVEAFTAMVNQLQQDTGGTFDHVNYELKSGARLAVTVGPAESEAPDLCKPPVLQGFAGAENLAIRVELIAPDTFLWGIDNAAPLHRISVDEDLTTITFQEPLPSDPANLPRPGQVLEILPLGARLANDEKTADYPIAADIGGHVLARILTPYDPISRTLTVAIVEADTDALDAMLAWDPGGGMFARVWNPGDAAPKDSFGVVFTLDTPVALPGTGLKVTFTARGIPGDHWILASRPSTPRGIVPWALRGGPGVPPHGPRRFYSPLALIHWTLDGMEIKPEAEDCRRRFRPLTRLRGCCTVTVGDDATSYGDFSSIQDAVDAIPLLEPGRICVLPGEYEERVVLHQRDDIVISGCGARTILRTPADNDTSQGLITLDECDRVTLKNLRIEASGQFGVMIVNESTAITLDGLDITTTLSGLPKLDLLPTDPSPYPPATLVAHHVVDLVVRGCKLTQSGETSRFPNVLLSSCVRADMRRCEVLTPGPGGSTSHAWGGVQLIEGDDITIEDNEIRYGEGHGITLGTITWEGLPDDYTGWFYPAAEVVMGDPEEDCPENKGGEPSSSEAFPVAAPTNLRIVGNRIRSMGGSGISVLGFMGVPFVETDPYLMIESYDLVIAENIIEDNFTVASAVDDVGTLVAVRAFGGVVLADSENLQIRDNVIRRNGVDFVDPVCGIYVFHGENVAIERNQIYANGVRVPGNGKAGHRAGIALQSVGRRVTQGESALAVAADRLLPAATVRGNIVHQPAGRALQIYGLGAMLVEGNTLTSEGPGEQDVPNDHADCIEIHNIGQGSELLESGLDPAPIPLSPHPALYYIPESPLDEFLEGRILFKDNQVRYNPFDAFYIACATRIQTFGDAAVLDNQFLTTFQANYIENVLLTDTIVVAWSTRTNNNRWDDPALVASEGPVTYQTIASARTLGVMNFTTMNQATRCIHAELVGGSPVPGPVAVNQVLTICDS